ncbi:MAG: hypothetical protein Q9221_001075 [Calogaya cf. arnoldii]
MFRFVHGTHKVPPPRGYAEYFGSQPHYTFTTDFSVDELERNGFSQDSEQVSDTLEDTLRNLLPRDRMGSVTNNRYKEDMAWLNKILEVEDGGMFLSDVYREIFGIPTFHIIGSSDPLIDFALALYNMCDQNKARLFDHGRGHQLVCIDDPEAAKVIFRSRNQLEKAQWYHVFTAPGEPDNLFSIRDNQQHLERRRQANEFYTTSAVNKIAYRIDHVSQLFLDKLVHEANSDGRFDLCQKMRFYVYDSLANITFGQVFGCLENDSDVNGLVETLGTFAGYGMAVGVFVEWHPVIIRLLQALTPGGNKGLLHLKRIGEDAMNKMDEPRDSSFSKQASFAKGNQRPHSFVSMWQERHRRDPSTFARDDIAYMIIPNIGAGADTVTATLNAAVYHLSRNPPFLARLRNELDAWAAAREPKTGNDIISTTEAQDLPYLQAVIKEAMRIFPGVGNNILRKVPEGGLTLADQFLPAGTTVGINPYVAHANRDVFGPDADDFRPERWLVNQETAAQMDQYFLSVTELVLRFEFTPINPEEEWTVYDDVFMYQENFQVQVKERSVKGAV